MRKLMLAVCGLAAVALLATGCKTTGTDSKTTLFDPATTQPIAEHREKTRTTGLFVNSQTANPQGTIGYTNTITTTNGLIWHVGEMKDFKAGSASYKSDAESIKATGEAVGNVAGQIIKK